MLINIHFIFPYIYVSIYYKFYNKLAHSSYQTNTKLKHKEQFKLWTQRKREHNNINSEYFQKSGVCMYVQILMFLIENLDNTCTFIL